MGCEGVDWTELNLFNTDSNGRFLECGNSLLTSRVTINFSKHILHKLSVWFSNEVMLTGKNPEPVCVSVPRLPSIKLCALFSNVYFAGRNLHMCIDMEGQWMGTSMFKVSYDCIRIGANGVVMLKPEDGGGLPHGTLVMEEEEDYDDVEEDDV
jgi:hypothetical protein